MPQEDEIPTRVTLLLRLPEYLKAALRVTAQANRRSMTREAEVAIARHIATSVDQEAAQ